MKFVDHPGAPTSADGLCAARLDGDVFRKLYESEAQRLVRYFHKRIGSLSEAEDLAHEALTRFLKASPRGEIQTPQAYLQTIAINLLRDRAEHSSHRMSELSIPLDEENDLPAPFDQHRVLVGRQELDHFETVLRQLKPRTLQIFLLSRVDGYTYKEIASALGMTLFGVKWHMLRAIEHIDRNRRSR